jgi:hypothetical protein
MYFCNYSFTCDHIKLECAGSRSVAKPCGVTFVVSYMTSLGRNYAFNEARSHGWVISRDRCTCYCPDCAKLYKSAGRSGNPKTKNRVYVKSKYKV